MKYLNLSSSINQEPEMICASHEQKGIWLDLICYCTTQKNGGIIKNCRCWSDDQWICCVGISKSDIESDSPIWTWRSEDLHVHQGINAY